MRITIHRGTKEIGGSCIELQTVAARLFLDIGLPLVDRDGRRMDNRKHSDLDLEQLKALHIAPDINALYQDASQFPDGLLLSHAHLDHYGLLAHIHKSTPIYCSKGTKKILEIAYLFGQSGFDPESVHTAEPWKAFQIGDFTVTPYLADHSAVDAFSYLIEAQSKRLFYTGDLRAHGRKAVLFESLIKKPPRDIDYLIMEGSTLGREASGLDNETDIEETLVNHFAEKRLYLISFSSQNIDRFVSVFRACLRTGRTLVVDPYTACVLDALRELSGNLPQFDWKNSFKIFFVPNTYTEKMAKSKRLFKYSAAKISFDQIVEDKDTLVLKDNYLLSRILKNKGLLPDATLIYSLWEGYLEEDNFWEKNSVPVIHVHCSGHAYRDDLIRLVEAIKPKKVIPNHTFCPQEFRKMFGDKAMLLEDGKSEDL